jgi:CDP-diacylglycerol---glycerol-3-phosphate 3-phosphatidyltransferase
VTALMIHYAIFGINAHVVGTIILYIALFLTLYSGIDYFIKFYKGIEK